MLLAQRNAMTPAERAAASEIICNAANELLAARLSPGAVISLYAAKGSEVDTAALDAFARAHALTVVYPRVVHAADTQALTFHAVSLDELAPARFGLLEPSGDARRVPIADIAMFAVPGLAFDRAGGRIGWGRGHYDATFAAASPSALRVGLAYDFQLLDEVAREPHDVALHIIITEVATHAVA